MARTTAGGEFVLCGILLWAAGCGSAPSPSVVEKPQSGTSIEPASSERRPKPPTPDLAAPPRFANVAKEAGLTAVLFCGGPSKDHILESVGSGCAWIDYDEDGRLDAFLVNAWSLEENPKRIGKKGRHCLYRNLGEGKFVDVAAEAGVDGDDWGCGVCAADYDNDGHIDLYVTGFGRNRLYRSRGNGTFEEVSERAGVAASDWSSGAAFFDADGDGWLDLYVAKYIDCTFDDVLAATRTTIWRETAKVMVGPFGLKGGRDCFYRNNRDGTFTEATDEAGLTDTAESYGLGVLASDLDLDGDVDLYVANDSNPNYLYRNDGGGKFTEVALWSGAALSGDGRSQASMGVDAEDFDGDGLPEIFTTNFAQDFCTFYRNEGALFFEDVSQTMRMKELTYANVKWGCAFVDFDRDSRLDILILNGHIYPQVEDYPKLSETYRQTPTLLYNIEGRFIDLSGEAGHQAESMRGLAVGDFDDDGKPDFLVTAIDAPPLLYHNQTQSRFHGAKVRLLNRHGSPAIHARVRVTAGGTTQSREVRSGSTYCSQNSFDLHLGLGDCEIIEKLEIRWPNGKTTLATDQPVDKTLVFREPNPPESDGGSTKSETNPKHE